MVRLAGTGWLQGASDVNKAARAGPQRNRHGGHSCATRNASGRNTVVRDNLSNLSLRSALHFRRSPAKRRTLRTLERETAWGLHHAIHPPVRSQIVWNVQSGYAWPVIQPSWRSFLQFSIRQLRFLI
jgi:hypothetical protein